MNILQQIKQKRIKQLLEEKKEFAKPSLKQALFHEGLGLIAEFKKASPSAGIITKDINLQNLASFYLSQGAVGFSVLTENAYFHGKNEYLLWLSENFSHIPMLRKDFIFDPFALFHAKHLGASCVLLIVNLLSFDELSYLHKLAHELELEVIVEVHDKNELQMALKIQNLDILGINNRNLENFEVSLQNSFDLIKFIPKQRNFAIISESGYKNKTQANAALNAGFDGILVGESMIRGGLGD